MTSPDRRDIVANEGGKWPAESRYFQRASALHREAQDPVTGKMTQNLEYCAPNVMTLLRAICHNCGRAGTRPISIAPAVRHEKRRKVT